MFEKVIVATDLSPASNGLVDCLGGLKAYGVKYILLLQCLTLQEVGSIALSYTTAFLNAALKEQKEKLERQGFEVETRTIPGRARTEINRISDEENCSLIVVGSQGHSLVGELFFGGVAYEVVHHARKPVLVVRLELVKGEGPDCVRAARCNFAGHILYPTDFSENADRAFEYVKEMAAVGVKHITLLHVQDRTRIEPHLTHRLDEFNKIDRERLERLKTDLSKKGGPRVDIALTFGSPFSEITKFIKEQDINLVIMGTQGRGFVEELFIGSVSHNVVRHSEVSVLLIPAKHGDK